MAIVGLVGGLGPESTVDYYRRILNGWKREEPDSAPSVVIDSLDAQLALRLVQQDRPALIAYLLASLRRLAGAGVDFAAITANTAHIVFDELAAQSPVPLLSIVEVCVAEASGGASGGRLSSARASRWRRRLSGSRRASGRLGPGSGRDRSFLGSMIGTWASS